jgi:hypothetical protein
MIMKRKLAKPGAMNVQQAEIALRKSEQKARAAKKTARIAKLRLKEVRRAAKQARKAARKAKDEFAAARKVFKRLLAKTEKIKGSARKTATAAKAVPSRSKKHKAPQSQVRVGSGNRVTRLPFKSKSAPVAPPSESAVPTVGS